jgi:hypothetical protein
MKICIITDERTGGTCFTSMFSGCNLKVCHDPQTSSKKRFNREFKDEIDLLKFVYEAHDVVKLCYVSFSIHQYTKILNYCIQHNIVIVILHRDDIYKRAQSKLVASNIKAYNIFDTSKNYKPFKISIESYKYNLENYNKHFCSHIQYLNDSNKPYYFVVYEELYINKNLIYDLFDHLSLTVTNKKHVENLLNKDYKTNLKNKLILNQDKLDKVNTNIQKPFFALTKSISFKNNTK